MVDLLCSKRPGAVDVPLLEHLLLNFGVPAQKIVERLYIGLGPVPRECEVVILEIQAHAREIN